MLKYNEFHILVPLYGYWTKYNWNKNEPGVGLDKERIDKLAEKDQIVVVRIGNSDRGYTIKAKKVQTFPVEQVKNWDKRVYIVRQTALDYKKIEDITDDSLARMGVFG